MSTPEGNGSRLEAGSVKSSKLFGSIHDGVTVLWSTPVFGSESAPPTPLEVSVAVGTLATFSFPVVSADDVSALEVELELLPLKCRYNRKRIIEAIKAHAQIGNGPFFFVSPRKSID